MKRPRTIGKCDIAREKSTWLLYPWWMFGSLDWQCDKGISNHSWCSHETIEALRSLPKGFFCICSSWLSFFRERLLYFSSNRRSSSSPRTIALFKRNFLFRILCSLRCSHLLETSLWSQWSAGSSGTRIYDRSSTNPLQLCLLCFTCLRQPVTKERERRARLDQPVPCFI